MVARAEQPCGIARGDGASVARSASTRNGSMCLPSTTGSPGPARAEVVAIVGGVQLAAEARAPSVRVAERRKERRGPFGDRQVERSSQVGNGEVVSRQPLEQRRRDTDGKPRASSPSSSSTRGVDLTEPAADAGRRVRRGGQRGRSARFDEWERGAGRFSNPTSASTAHAREEQPAQRRAAVVGGEARRQRRARCGRPDGSARHARSTNSW